MQQWIDDLIKWTRLTPDTFWSIVQTVGIVLVILLIRALAFRLIRNRITDVRSSYYWRRGVNFVCGILALIIAICWFAGIKDVGTFLGLLSAGLAVALSDLLANFAGWIFIMTRRPFVVGDRIQINETKGDVIDIRLFNTFLLECGNWVDAEQSTGRIIMIPNGSVFRNVTANYTRTFEHIWDEVNVLVTFESDWKKAKKILTQIAEDKVHTMSAGVEEQIRRAASKHMIFFQKLTPIVYTTVKDSGVQLTLRYLTLPRSRRSAEQIVWESILDRFAEEPQIDLAYPTIRYYANQHEGKPQMRASAACGAAPPDPDDPRPV